jgi:hypothetical protein
LIIGGVVLIAVIAIAALVVIPNAAPAPVTEVAATAGVPTPFADSRTINTDEYTVSIPRQWIPPQGFYDLSDGDRLVHIWQDSSLDSYVALILPVDPIAPGEEGFEHAVQDYVDKYYEGQAHLTLIDESTAPDGTIRRSNRLVNSPEPPFPPGQQDVFFINRAPNLVILEVYSSDEMGNRLVGTFQSILDSLQVKST